MKKKVIVILLLMVVFISKVKAAPIQEVFLDQTILVDNCTIYNSSDDHLSLINIGNDKCLITPVKIGSAKLNLNSAVSATQEVNFYNVTAGQEYDLTKDYIPIGKYVNTINTGAVTKELANEMKSKSESKSDYNIKAAYYEKVLYIAMGYANGEEVILEISFDEDTHKLTYNYNKNGENDSKINNVTSVASYMAVYSMRWLMESSKNYSEIQKIDKNQNSETYQNAVLEVFKDIYKYDYVTHTEENKAEVKIDYMLILDNNVNNKIISKYTELLATSNNSKDPTQEPNTNQNNNENDNKGPGVKNPDTGVGSVLFVVVLGLIAIVFLSLKGKKIYKI